MSVVAADGVSKVYGNGSARVAALDGIDFRVSRGEFVAVMGPSGSGKSTLLQLIAAMDRPTEGRIVVDGQDIAGLDQRAAARFRLRSIGFIFQAFNLLPNLTALENVALPLAFAGIAPRERRRQAYELLERLGLGERAAHHPPTLSGGERQRVAVARALVNRPLLLLADEPTGNLDSKSAAAVLDLLADLRRTSGQTVLLITHDTGVAARGDRVVRLHDGRVQAAEHAS